jgi:RNA polymerase sigma-70 factor (ECF subfamily)
VQKNLPLNVSLTRGVETEVSGRILQVETAAPEQEAALVARARGGDREAQNTLLRSYLPDVYGLTSRLLREPDLAADAAQDAMVNAMRGLAQFRGDASFRTWLLRIAVNTARSAARKRSRRREVDLEVVRELADDRPEPDRATVTRMEADRASKMLERLPPKQHLAVTLRIHSGLSYAEVAQVMKSTEGAARVNYHLGIKRLRELLG